MQSDCISISNSMLTKSLFPTSVPLPLQVSQSTGYRRPLSSSCTRFPSDFPLRSGTDHTFSSPVPGFRPISCSGRVQITLFLLLYPVSVRFPAPVGYRLHFSFSCTRFPSDFPLRSGTDRTFPSPVPDRLLFFATLRVQEALFSLLYPYHFGLSQQIHFEELRSCRLDYPCPFFLAFLWKCQPLCTSDYMDRAKKSSGFTASHLRTPHLPP